MHHAITLEALRVLQAIHEKGSFAAAAETLFKVPSALTYTVQKLESDLDTSLFDRRGQRAVLTNAGRLVLEEGRALLDAAQRLEEKVKQVESGWETRLTIAKDTVVCGTSLLNIIGEFCALDKQVEITVVEEALGGGWDALHSRRADVAIGVTGELPKGQYHVSQIGMLEFVFAVSAQHPLADYIGMIEPEEFQKYPSIVVSDTSRALPQRSSGLFESKQQIRVPDMATKIDAQIAGIGIGFVPLHMARKALDEGTLVAKSAAVPRPPIPIYVAYEKGRSGKALAWFCDQIERAGWL